MITEFEGWLSDRLTQFNADTALVLRTHDPQLGQLANICQIFLEIWGIW